MIAAPGAPFPSAPAAPLAVVLAGGRSRRFGSPKALARVGGETVVARVGRALGEVAEDPVLIGHDPEVLRAAGLPARPDLREGAGPLAGIHAALLWARELGRPGALCVACDLPFLPGGLLAEIAARAAGSRADAVVPRNGARAELEPLCAWYAPSVLPVAERLLEGDRRSLRGLLAQLRVEEVSDAAVRLHGRPERIFHNLNTPADLQRAQRLAAAGERVDERS